MVIDENILMMIIWLSLLIIAIIAELATTALVSVWFCIGAALALAVTFIPGMPWWGEVIVFLGSSIIALLALRPLANRMLQRNMTKSNIDGIIGKKGKVTKTITDLEAGEVKIQGVYWTAIPVTGVESIQEDAIVEVVSVEGNKLFVKEIEK